MPAPDAICGIERLSAPPSPRAALADFPARIRDWFIRRFESPTLAQRLEGMNQLLTDRSRLEEAGLLLDAAVAIRENIGAPVLPF